MVDCASIIHDLSRAAARYLTMGGTAPASVDALP
jgi:hypothetical protein